MKDSKKFLVIVALITAALYSFCGCSSLNRDYAPSGNDYTQGLSGNEYNEIIENPVTLVSETPLSTFSMDVNTAAYSNLRRYINEGRKIDKNQVRIEEMVNYFSYDYPNPQEGEPLSISTAVFPCPWNNNARLLTIGLRSEEIEFSQLNNNLVFLLDVSGSMNSADKIGLMKTAFSMLTENLNDNDTVSIVTYAGSDKVVLRGAKGTQKDEILSAIQNLSAGGSTAGAKGIITAYELAETYFIQGGNNRVILATDGDFNVGVSSQDGLESLISEKRESGVYFTALGFGYGNLKDNKLVTLANSGNGNYGYIDSVTEARKLLVEQIGGTLKTVAKDVKTQIEFNPAKVYSYRLLGYENKLLSNEDWENDQKDAGEIGAGHTVTAVYEIVLNEGVAESTMGDNYLKVSIRYKEPQGDSGVKEMYRYTAQQNITDTPNQDQSFISAVVESALIMRNSEYKGEANLDNIIQRLESLDLNDDYKTEFLALMDKLNSYDFS